MPDSDGGASKENGHLLYSGIVCGDLCNAILLEMNNESHGAYFVFTSSLPGKCSADGGRKRKSIVA